MSLRRSFGFPGSLAVLGLCLTQVPACTQTPKIVPVRSMERPKDFDLICLHKVGQRYEGAPRERCGLEGDFTTPRFPAPEADGDYRLHAVVTQVPRGELAVADIGRTRADTAGLVKIDPWLPGMTFIPVGGVPTDVAADPEGRAVYVSSGRVEKHEGDDREWSRIDIIPANVLRGPINTTNASDDSSPWPALLLDATENGVPAALYVVRDDPSVISAPSTSEPTDEQPTPVARRLYALLPDAKPRPKIAVFDIAASPLMPVRLPDIVLTDGAVTTAALAPVSCPGGKDPAVARAPWWETYDRCTTGARPSGPPTPNNTPVPPAPGDDAGAPTEAGVGDALDDAGAPTEAGVGDALDDAEPRTEAAIADTLQADGGADDALTSEAGSADTLATDGGIDAANDVAAETSDAAADGGDGSTTSPSQPKAIARPSDMAWAGGLLFVSDSALPVIHVFDVRDPWSVKEVHRIGIDAPLARLSISPIVPDEVNLYNAPAVSICELNGWLGDGINHSADNPVVAQRLHGFCRAHRYIYGIDRANAERGDGQLMAIDLPVQVTWGGPCIEAIQPGARDAFQMPTCRVVTSEKFDFANVRIEQPSACLWPGQGKTAGGEPTQRLLLGMYGQNAAPPVRAITFVKSDSQSPKLVTRNGLDRGLHGLRCRPGPLQYPNEGISKEYTDAMESWRNALDPRTRLRGVYALALRTNGQLVVITVDDYDASCRGPKVDSNLEAFANRSTATTNPWTFEELAGASPKEQLNTTGEILWSMTPRHQTRIAGTSDGFLAVDKAPSISAPILSRQTRSGSVNIATLGASDLPASVPQMQRLRQDTDSLRSGTVLPSPESPYGLTTETWTVTYQGILPGFDGKAGSFQTGDGPFTLLDPTATFCSRGVEAEASTALSSHDFVQITGDVCEKQSCCESCSSGEQQQIRDLCISTFGSVNDILVPPTVETATPQGTTLRRDLVITRAFNGKLELNDRDLYGNPVDKALLKTCFPGLTRYVVRARDSWVVVGSMSGYLHNRTVDPNSADAACTVAADVPRVMQGRAREMPPLGALPVDPFAGYPKSSTGEIDNCLLFVNPSIRFAIRAGSVPATDAPGSARVIKQTERDMRYTFTVRFPPAGQTLGLMVSSIATLPDSIAPLADFRHGVDVLGWGRFGVIDSQDNGLVLISVDNVRSFGFVN